MAVFCRQQRGQWVDCTPCNTHKIYVHEAAALQAAEGPGHQGTGTGAAPLPAAFAAAGRLVSADASHAAPCAAAALRVLQYGTTGESIACLPHHCVLSTL